MPKRTYQPKNKKIVKKQGFLKKMETKNGRNTLKRRRAKGRASLAISKKK
jgi:large subunit ribosomal protein L34